MKKKVKKSYRGVYLSTALVTSLALMHPVKSYAVVSPAQTPTGGTVVGGSATITTPSAGTLNINQSTNRAIINWASFNIGSSATVDISEPSASSLSVERVLSSGVNPTQILGTLEANGQVMVLDKNGVIFEPGSIINVGGIVASTGDVSNTTVMSGTSKIPITQATSTGTVENDGTITVAGAGLAALVAPNALNNGTINANLGHVYLAAGETATVDFSGDGLVSLATSSNLTHALLGNAGTINAQGGTVTMSTAVARNILDNEMNMNGLVNASSATVQGGTIILSSNGDASVNLAGTLDADGGTNGGTINVSGQNISGSGTITAQGNNGSGGTVTFNGLGTVDVSGVVNTNGQTAGGQVMLNGNNVYIGANGDVTALGQASTGIGGTIRLIALDNAEILGTADVSGSADGGTIGLNSEFASITGTANALSTTSGYGGGIALNANNIQLEGIENAQGVNGGGSIWAVGQSVQVTQSGQLLASSTSSGDGGNITLNGLLADQMHGLLHADGISSGGNITFTGSDIDLSGTATAETTQSGPAGNITLNSGSGSSSITGTANVDGNYGGTIDVTGGTVDISGKIEALGTGGIGGLIHLNASQNAQVSGTINATGLEGGGTIFIDGGNSVNVSGSVTAAPTVVDGSARAPALPPGSITLDAPTVLFSGLLDVNGFDGGGIVTLTGGSIFSSGNIEASSTLEHDGGTITFSGTTLNQIYSGTLSATGGSSSGNGGTITVDTPNTVAASVVTNVSAPAGTAGTYTH